MQDCVAKWINNKQVNPSRGPRKRPDHPEMRMMPQIHGRRDGLSIKQSVSMPMEKVKPGVLLATHKSKFQVE